MMLAHRSGRSLADAAATVVGPTRRSAMERRTNPRMVEEQRGLGSDIATGAAQGFGAGFGGVAAHKVYNTVTGRLRRPKRDTPKKLPPTS